jgi:acyl phosphate:glycerol-3-phosphate acyltransferase
MPNLFISLLCIVLAYLIGSMPPGLLIVRLFSGKDIREVGSGRTGGTNAMRAAGWVAGVLTAFSDIFKGFVAVYVTRLISPGFPILEAVCAVAAVAGHNWPIFLRFKGGAGTSPNVGAALAFWPITGLLLIPFGAIVLFGTGYASVASTVISFMIIIIFIVRALVANQPVAHIGYAVLSFVLVAIALLPNYRRLIAGTERIVGPRAKRIEARRQAAEMQQDS